MSREKLTSWVEDYERAWRTAGIDMLERLFTPDATYLTAPFEAPITGRAAIGAFWEAEREGPDEVFSMAWEPVAVEGNVGVVRVEVHYGEPPVKTYRDLWVVTLDQDGRCSAFEEWPFFPGQLGVAE